jgi:hypothetical protein
MSGKRVKSGGRSRARPRVAGRSVKVSAVRTSQGPPATTVQVEVESEELRRELGDLGEVRGVVASIPGGSEGGPVRWTEERLESMGSAERETDGRRRRVTGYQKVHYGPSDPALGVDVKVETDRGPVQAQPPGQATRVKDASQPGESGRQKRGKGRR